MHGIKNLVCLTAALSLGVGAALFVAGANRSPAYRGLPIRLWIAELAVEDYQVRARASEAVRMIGPQATPYLIRTLEQQDSPLDRIIPGLAGRLSFPRLGGRTVPAALREKAAEQLGLLGDQNPRAVRALLDALDDSNRDVLSSAQRALRRLSPGSIPFLVEALHRRSPRIRANAAEALMDLGPEAAEAVPALIQALKDPDEMVRTRAVQALGVCARPSETNVAALVTALEDPQSRVRTAAAESLTRFGPGAGSAIPALIRGLGDSDVGTRVCMARALWKITGQADRVVPVLIDVLPQRSAAWQAPFVLGEIGPRAAPAIPALLEALKRERVSRPLRSPPCSASALGQIGPAAVPGLIETLRDERACARCGAAIALGFIGAPAGAAVPALVGLLKDKDLEVRQASALTLGSIAPEANELAPALIELTQDDDIFISSAAVAALRKNNPALASRMGL